MNPDLSLRGNSIVQVREGEPDFVHYRNDYSLRYTTLYQPQQE
ncbi:hypothetical protein [Methanoregula sp.]